MDLLLHQLIAQSAKSTPDAPALSYRQENLTYGELNRAVREIAVGLKRYGLLPGQRVAVYLPKSIETVIALIAVAQSGGIFVPVNPGLKTDQVSHILTDSEASMLITSSDRHVMLGGSLHQCPSVKTIIHVGTERQDSLLTTPSSGTQPQILPWSRLLESGATDADPLSPELKIHPDDSVAILYTSGSTGMPKGVELTHQNLVLGAQSVAEYLKIDARDRLLAVLPLSFDYGLNQLTTAFLCGATVVLLNYLLPRDVIKAIETEQITGLAGVPSLWAQLSGQEKDPQAFKSLRYLTNSGGAMPPALLDRLQGIFPSTQIFLMYGLTEAFRSTYLPPDKLDQHPTSMGKPIPNAELYVINENGQPCQPGEPGELVHAGPLVAKGYWNNPTATAKRFRNVCFGNATIPEQRAVWSGDQVVMDKDGYFYFLHRRDDQLKSSGYRISPMEIEDVLLASGQVLEAAIIGVPHDTLGQAIIAFFTPAITANHTALDEITIYCRKHLPGYQMPQEIISVPALPKTPHGKIDRLALQQEYAKQPR